MASFKHIFLSPVFFKKLKYSPNFPYFSSVDCTTQNPFEGFRKKQSSSSRQQGTDNPSNSHSAQHITFQFLLILSLHSSIDYYLTLYLGLSNYLSN